VLPFFWIPEAKIKQRRKNGVSLDPWIKAGLIEVTPGETVDYNFILSRIAKLKDEYDFRKIAFDRWGAAKLRADIEAAAGVPLVQFGEGFASMSAPMKELQKLVVEANLSHGGHPVLSWMADNVVARVDPAGNIKPDKEKSVEKIDGIVALIMALDRALRWRETQNVYETRGLRVIDIA
jgi:phage terminase large subunit-like protein